VANGADTLADLSGLTPRGSQAFSAFSAFDCLGVNPCPLYSSGRGVELPGYARGEQDRHASRPAARAAPRKGLPDDVPLIVYEEVQYSFLDWSITTHVLPHRINPTSSGCTRWSTRDSICISSGGGFRVIPNHQI